MLSVMAMSSEANGHARTMRRYAGSSARRRGAPVRSTEYGRRGRVAFDVRLLRSAHARRDVIALPCTSH
ncbi:hypothetical protein WS71_03400 [Burkholderia mayonis]|uniref:Uncharacterized protein n=1 Tax=Burkholderia mayonis TaxID=1385591 RepID=A0A1B4FS61_9BURK|nr:hypothetical protein WS71_03400 [Burkholderia mayonis]KVE51576.1 hypothetical protein WS71_11045 [Burkholderia mayonis]